VKASIAGAIMTNALFMLGASFLLGASSITPGVQQGERTDAGRDALSGKRCPGHPGTDSADGLPGSVAFAEHLSIAIAIISL